METRGSVEAEGVSGPAGYSEQGRPSGRGPAVCSEGAGAEGLRGIASVCGLAAGWIPGPLPPCGRRGPRWLRSGGAGYARAGRPGSSLCGAGRPPRRAPRLEGRGSGLGRSAASAPTWRRSQGRPSALTGMHGRRAGTRAAGRRRRVWPVQKRCELSCRARASRRAAVQYGLDNPSKPFGVLVPLFHLPHQQVGDQGLFGVFFP